MWKHKLKAKWQGLNKKAKISLVFAVVVVAFVVVVTPSWDRRELEIYQITSIDHLMMWLRITIYKAKKLEKNQSIKLYVVLED